MNLIPLLSTVVTFVFALSVFRRYLVKGGAHLLVWSIGLLFYGMGTLTEVLLGLTYHELLLKIWYLCGAMLTAAWLGQGTIYLLIHRKNVTHGISFLLALCSIVAVVLLAFAPVTSAAASFNLTLPVSTQYKSILVRSGAITALTILLNIYGTITMVGGAIYSGILFWRKSVLLNRVIGNILIAAGALAPAMAGSLVKAGVVDALYFSELIGAVLMYIGFLQATTAPAQVPTTAPARG